MKKVLGVLAVAIFASALVFSCEKEPTDDYETIYSIDKDKVETPGGNG